MERDCAILFVKYRAKKYEILNTHILVSVNLLVFVQGYEITSSYDKGGCIQQEAGLNN